MPSFSYSACSNDGKVKNGKMSANSSIDLENKLFSDGFTMLHSKKVVEKKKSSFIGWWGEGTRSHYDVCAYGAA